MLFCLCFLLFHLLYKSKYDDVVGLDICIFHTVLSLLRIFPYGYGLQDIVGQITEFF